MSEQHWRHFGSGKCQFCGELGAQWYCDSDGYGHKKCWMKSKKFRKDELN